MSEGTASAELGNFLDNGPPVYVQDAVDALKRRLLPLTGRRAEFVTKIGKVQTIRDREDVGAAADVIGLAGDVGKMVEAEQKAVAGPHADAVSALSNYAAKFWAPVEEEVARLRGLVNDFVREERRLAAVQAAEQRATEAQIRASRVPANEGAPAEPDPAPAPLPAKRRSYRGDYGRQAIAVDDYEIEIVDPRALPDFIFETDKVREAIVAVAKGFRKTGIKQIPGLNITVGVKTQIRK